MPSSLNSPLFLCTHNGMRRASCDDTKISKNEASVRTRTQAVPPMGRHLNTARGVLKVFALLLMSGLNVLLPTWYGAETWRSSFTTFPVCTPVSLDLPVLIPQFIQPNTTCQLLILSTAISTAAYWICAFSLLRDPRWVDRYTPKITFAAFCGLVVELMLRRDIPSMVLEVVPLYVDIGVVLGLAAEWRSCPMEREYQPVATRRTLYYA